MASGRPDYWYGMLPGHSSMSINQSAWLKEEEKLVNPGNTANLVEYTVPANYVLNISGGIISCFAPGLQMAYVHYAGLNMGLIVYDTNIVLPLSPSGTYVINADETIWVQIYNRDSVEWLFSVVLKIGRAHV